MIVKVILHKAMVVKGIPKGLKRLNLFSFI